MHSPLDELRLLRWDCGSRHTREPPEALRVWAVGAIDTEAEAADRAPAAQQFPVPLGLYVVSIQRSSTLRRLHLVGNRPLIPGVDFHKYEMLGEVPPDTSAYSKVCSRSFPQAAEQVTADSSGEEVSSSSSESDGALP